MRYAVACSAEGAVLRGWLSARVWAGVRQDRGLAMAGERRPVLVAASVVASALADKEALCRPLR